MVLVDTSVWVAHLRVGNSNLGKLLNDGHVVCHRFIVGELACANLKNRTEILSLLQALPWAIEAEHEEVLQAIESKKLMGTGLGYIDVALIVSALLTEAPIWTLDKKLKEVSDKLNIGYQNE